MQSPSPRTFEHNFFSFLRFKSRITRMTVCNIKTITVTISANETPVFSSL